MGWFRSVNKNGTEYKPVGNVITATSLSVTGPALAAGDVVRVMFTTDIAGSDTSTPLALTWNSGVTPIPVKVAKEGTLASVYAHEVATNIFKYISGYVTLEMAFDGTNLVIIGNPVVLSGAGYTIYANGYNDFVNNCELSGWENATDFTGAAIPWTVPYDGFLSILLSGVSEVYSRLYINNIEVSLNYGESNYQINRQVVPVKKGDVVSGNVTINAIRCSFYKKRDYSNR